MWLSNTGGNPTLHKLNTHTSKVDGAQCVHMVMHIGGVLCAKGMEMWGSKNGSTSVAKLYPSTPAYRATLATISARKLGLGAIQANTQAIPAGGMYGIQCTPTHTHKTKTTPTTYEL